MLCRTACATNCQECVPLEDSSKDQSKKKNKSKPRESSREMDIGRRDCAKCEPGYVLTTPTHCDGQTFLHAYSMHYSLYFITSKHTTVKERAWLNVNVVFQSFSVFSARRHIWYSALWYSALYHAIARPSVTRVDQSKTVEVRITQPSPQSSTMTLVSWSLTSPWNFKLKIGSGGAE